jgi:18S rRNA (guanine1575-N7)-methyltransferase
MAAEKVKLPQGLSDESLVQGGEEVSYARERSRVAHSSSSRRKPIKDKNWLLRKKELNRARGKDNVPLDSKFTGRKRGPRF